MKQIDRGRVLDRLFDIQVERALSGPQMARLLGIDKSLWYHLRAGRRQLSLAAIRRAEETFPELRGVHVIEDGVPPVTDGHELLLAGWRR